MVEVVSKPYRLPALREKSAGLLRLNSGGTTEYDFALKPFGFRAFFLFWGRQMEFKIEVTDPLASRLLTDMVRVFRQIQKKRRPSPPWSILLTVALLLLAVATYKHFDGFLEFGPGVSLAGNLVCVALLFLLIYLLAPFLGLWVQQLTTLLLAGRQRRLRTPGADAYTVDVGAGQLCINDCNGVKEVHYQEVTAIYETALAFYLCTGGAIFYLLPKADFVQGTAAAFGQFMVEKCGKSLFISAKKR